MTGSAVTFEDGRCRVQCGHQVVAFTSQIEDVIWSGISRVGFGALDGQSALESMGMERGVIVTLDIWWVTVERQLVGFAKLTHSERED